MSTSNYIRLQELDIDTFNLDAPVEVEKGALLLESKSKTVLLQLRLNVLDNDNEISSTSLNIYGFTDSGEPVEGFSPFIHTYSDVYLQRSKTFGDRTPVVLDPRIRKVNIEIDRVVHRNGDVWRNPEGYFTPPKQESIGSIDARLVPQFKREIEDLTDSQITRIVEIPLQCENYWLCACGRPNLEEADECKRCGLRKAKAFSLTEVNLQKALDLHSEEQKRIELETTQRAAEKEAQLTEMKRVRRKTLKRVAIVFGSLSAIILLTIFVVLPALKYSKASNLLADGQFDEAIYMFDSLRDYRNSGEMLLEVNYQKANYFLESKNFDEAVKTFSYIEAYKDSASLIKEARFQEASMLLSKEDFEKAKTIFVNLEDYKTSADMVKEVDYQKALRLIGNKELDKAKEIFMELDEYKDAKEMVKEAVYQKAITAHNEKDHATAISNFIGISGYKETDSYLSDYYKLGKQDLQSDKFDEAILIFQNLKDYEDSIELEKEAKYQQAVKFFEVKKYADSSGIFAKLGSYKDSKQYWSEGQYLLGVESLGGSNFAKAATIFKSLNNYKDSEELSDIAKLNRTSPKEIINMLSQAISSKETKSLSTFIPSDGLLYTNFYEGGVTIAKDSFLEEFLKKVNSSTRCLGITQFDDSFTVWYLNWTPDWQMTQMCYGKCWTLTPTWYSDYAGFNFKKDAGYYQLTALILKDPYTFYKDLGYKTAPLMSCTSYPTCLGAPQTRLAVGMQAKVCLTSGDTQVVRWSPGRSSQVITSLYRGSIVSIIGGPTCSLEKWTWWEVRIPNGRTGWMTEGGDSESQYYLCPLK